MFDKDKAWRDKEPLQLIHIGICHPNKTSALSHAVYFLTFIDDYSHKSWVYFLKHKSETFGIFQKFRSMFEDESSKCIMNLRIDNGGELIKIKLNAYLYLYKHGIQHQNIVPCTPQQNGVVERKNRTLVEMTRCML